MKASDLQLPGPKPVQNSEPPPRAAPPPPPGAPVHHETSPMVLARDTDPAPLAARQQDSMLAPFRTGLELQIKRRDLFVQLVWQNFQKSVDYGYIPGKKKPFMLKPGAEKATGLLECRAEFERDNDTWEMFGKETGLVCYVCKLVRIADGVVLGEGGGAARISEKKGWTENNCIKIARKRAHVDAVLRVAMLSEVFVQDEDFGDTSPPPALKYGPVRQDARPPRPAPATSAEEIPEDILETLQHMLALNTQLDNEHPAKLNIHINGLVQHARKRRAEGQSWDTIRANLEAPVKKLDEALQQQLAGGQDDAGL